jgi:hypothetical protein
MLIPTMSSKLYRLSVRSLQNHAVSTAEVMGRTVMALLRVAAATAAAAAKAAAVAVNQAALRVLLVNSLTAAVVKMKSLSKLQSEVNMRRGTPAALSSLVSLKVAYLSGFLG